MSVTWRTWLHCSLPPPGIPVFVLNFILRVCLLRQVRRQDQAKARTETKLPPSKSFLIQKLTGLVN